jgi:hypothetical protein
MRTPVLERPRSAVWQIRVTEEEKRVLELRAKEAGMSTADWVRKKLGLRIHPEVPRLKDAKKRRQLHKLSKIRNKNAMLREIERLEGKHEPKPMVLPWQQLGREK